ncbi:hypothetical protein D3C71_1864330 [compost metagenome]
MSPPITATAMGERKLASAAPSPTAIGSMPAPMARVVMMMGRARLWQASISASKRVMPCSRRARMAYSTSKIEFFVAMPMSMISPMSDGIEKLFCAISSPTKAPPSDNGSAARMVTGCRKSLNSSTSTM